MRRDMAPAHSTVHFNSPDEAFETSLRPGQFTDFTGQTKVLERLSLCVEAAKARGDALDHILLCGPPGLGKTTIAFILGAAMGVNVKATSGPILTKPADLAGMLTGLERGDILFIDEIHSSLNAGAFNSGTKAFC